MKLLFQRVFKRTPVGIGKHIKRPTTKGSLCQYPGNQVRVRPGAPGLQKHLVSCPTKRTHPGPGFQDHLGDKGVGMGPAHPRDMGTVGNEALRTRCPQVWGGKNLAEKTSDAVVYVTQ